VPAVKLPRAAPLLLGLAVLGCLLALTHLMALPAFEDEGTQLRLMQRLLYAGEWLAPLGDGKPLEVWLMAPLASLAREPLWAVRAVHVLVGLGCVLLSYRLARNLTGAACAALAALLVAVCPFTVYLERLALADIVLCAAGLGVLVSTLAYARQPDRTRATALAAVLVLAGMAKLPVGFVFLGALPLALLLMPRERRPPRATLTLLALGPAAVLALVVLAVALARVGSGHAAGFGIQDLLGIGGGGSGDIAAAMHVARPDLWTELTAQLSAPLVALAIIGLLACARLHGWQHRWLILAGLIPMLAIGLLPRFWYSRYLLFTLPPLIVASLCGWVALWERLARLRPALLAAVLLAVGFMSVQSARLIIDPATARWSDVDRFQYIEGWTSGYGYPEAADYLRAAHPTLMIYALDGHSAEQLLTYLPQSWRAQVHTALYADDGSTLQTAAARLDHLLAHSPFWIIAPAQLLARSLRATAGAGAEQALHVSELQLFDKPGQRGALGIYTAVAAAPPAAHPH